MSNKFFIKKGSVLSGIWMSDILFIKSDGDYCVIMLHDLKQIRIHSTLVKLEEKLPKDIFCRIARTHIVNLERIMQVQYKTIIVMNHEIPLGEDYREEFYRRIVIL